MEVIIIIEAIVIITLIGLWAWSLKVDQTTIDNLINKQHLDRDIADTNYGEIDVLKNKIQRLQTQRNYYKNQAKKYKNQNKKLKFKDVVMNYKGDDKDLDLLDDLTNNK